MVGVGFEGNGLDCLLEPKHAWKHSFLFGDNSLEGQHNLKDWVSVSMSRIGGQWGHICTLCTGLVVVSVWVDTSILSCDRNLGYCVGWTSVYRWESCGS
jgi:hypothetical protein